MENKALHCEIKALAIGAGQITLAFQINNLNYKPVAVRYFTPFAAFELQVFAGGEKVPVVQPAYETGLQPVDAVIPAGGSIMISTPIRLRFDPQVGPSGGNNPLVWSLVHVQAPVLIRAVLHLAGLTLEPCEVPVEPG
jgi:hypothetical protein